jgi:dienelactone hydrolase
LIPAHFTGATYQTDAFRGVPVAPGRFPLVVFSHGYSGFRDQSTFLTTRLASWGFVVAAADLPDNDLTAVLSGVQSQGSSADLSEQKQVITLMGADAKGSGQFHGHIDMSRVAAVGHSLGGALSEALAATDPRITTFIWMAGATVGSFGQTPSGAASMVPNKPGMLRGDGGPGRQPGRHRQGVRRHEATQTARDTPRLRSSRLLRYLRDRNRQRWSSGYR